MLAGHDTTATALAYSLWILGHHPDVQDRVAAEAAEIGDRELTPEDVPRLGYTVQVLREALRLQPPAAGVARLATRDIAVAGHRVEAGTIMAVVRYTGIPRCGTDRWYSIPTGSARQPPRAATVGNFSRSSLDRARVSVNTSRCWRRLSHWVPSSGRSKSVPWAGISRSLCRSPRSPTDRSGHACVRGTRTLAVWRSAVRVVGSDALIAAPRNPHVGMRRRLGLRRRRCDHRILRIGGTRRQTHHRFPPRVLNTEQASVQIRRCPALQGCGFHGEIRTTPYCARDSHHDGG